MIRTTAVPRLVQARPVRAGAAVAGIAGMLALAGCAAPEGVADAVTQAPTSRPTTSSAPSTTAGSSASDSAYADGTYRAEGSYATPESVESISVTLTLADDIVTAVEVTGDPQKAESKQYQSKFIGGISDAVVGKSVDDISVSRVAGSSLTSGGFNQAVEQIKSKAAA